MKMLNMFGCLALTAALSMPLMAEDEKNRSIEEVKKAVEESQNKFLDSWMDQAEEKMIAGDFEAAQFLLTKVFEFDDDNARAKKLKKLNKKYLKKADGQESRLKYAPMRDRSLEDNIASLENNGGSMDDLRKMANGVGLPKVSESKNSWAGALIKKLSNNRDFCFTAKGKDLVSKLGEVFDVNVVVDAGLRSGKAFAGSLEINYKKMRGENILNNLCREWGAQWDLQNQAIVLSKAPTTKPEMVETQADLADMTYRELWGFPRVDFGDLGLKAAMPSPGAGEWGNPYVIPPGYQVVSPDGQVRGGHSCGVGLGFARSLMTADGQLLWVTPDGKIISGK